MSTRASSGGDTLPLVTFLVIGFNQERYIRDAIQSAFDQSYVPMEIVLSDDCSGDSTYDIMLEMAGAYRGPNKVSVVRNAENVGCFRHILARGREANSDIVIVGEGDDISLPNRATKIAAAFSSDTACVYSLVSIIDERGKIVAPVASRPLRLRRVELFLREYDDGDIIQGSSAAYRRWVFDVPITPRNRDTTEDFYFAHYLKLLGAGIVRLDEPLLKYRRHPHSYSNYGAISYLAEEKRNLWHANSMRDTIDDIRELAALLGKSTLLDREFIELTRLAMVTMSEWNALSFAGRMERTFALVPNGIVSSSSRYLAWCLIRLWGGNPRYQPKLFISRFQKKYERRPARGEALGRGWRSC